MKTDKSNVGGRLCQCKGLIFRRFSMQVAGVRNPRLRFSDAKFVPCKNLQLVLDFPVGRISI